MAIRAVLRLNEREYEVRSFEQIFQLPVQRVDGYPSGPFPYNGELLINLSTPPDDYLIDLMFDLWEEQPISGELQVFDGLSDQPFRRISFRRATIIGHQEQFSDGTPIPYEPRRKADFCTTLRITPRELAINKFIRLTRDFGWRWHKVKDEELSPRSKSITPEVRLIDAYWIKEDGSKSRVFPIGRKVCLHLILSNYEDFIGQDLSFDFEEETKEGVYSATVSGTVTDDGHMKVDSFELSIIEGSHGNSKG